MVQHKKNIEADNGKEEPTRSASLHLEAAPEIIKAIKMCMVHNKHMFNEEIFNELGMDWTGSDSDNEYMDWNQFK